MKVLVLFALLFVVANAQFGNPHNKEPTAEDSPFPEFEDEDYYEEDVEIVNTDEDDDTVTTEEDDDDDDDDDDPTTTPKPKCQCKKKFWECKKRVRPYDCDGKLKCFEEKSKCYREYKAKNPNMPTKSPEKMACKTTFEGCIAKTDGTCRSKLMCYMAKQRCYMKFKKGGHRGRPHHRRRPHGHGRRHHRRRPHHHRRPTPCPKMMKCKKEWRQCMIRSKSCSDKLACFWKGHKCMEKNRTSPSPTPTATASPSPALKRRWRPRRWNPKVVAKCKENFEKCINSTSDCRKQLFCFMRMKKCIMQGHRPTPCPKMLKCKMEYKNCSEEATTCDQKLACMYQKHECYERIRPTTPPPQTDSDDDDDDDRMYGYGRRPRWNPKLKEKCKKELHKCLNESDSCQKKMKCFWGMKKCMMGRRPGMHEMMKPYIHKIHSKLTALVSKIRGLFSKGQLQQRYKNWRQQQGKNWHMRKQRMKKKFGIAHKNLKKKLGMAKNRMQQWRKKPWFG